MTGVSTSCGACKFLRRKCTSECVFAPYFSYDEAIAHFSAVHKVFGASNVSRLLHHLPEPYRGEAALTISFEAIARMRDPVYGCVAYIYALQQEVANLQEEIEVIGNQMANDLSIIDANDDLCVGYQAANNNSNNNLMINNDSLGIISSQENQMVDVQDYLSSTNNYLWKENGSCSSQMVMSKSNHTMMNFQVQDYSSSYLWQGQNNLYGFTDTSGSGAHECLVEGLVNQETLDYSSSLFGLLPDIKI